MSSKGNKVRTQTLKVNGTDYKCDLRMKGHQHPVFFMVCKAAQLETVDCVNPEAAAKEMKRVLEEATSLQIEKWLLITLEVPARTWRAKGEVDGTSIRLEAEYSIIERAGINTAHERHRLQGHVGWAPGAPRVRDDEDGGATYRRFLLVKKDRDALLRVRKLIAAIEEVWFAWLVHTEPGGDLPDLLNLHGRLLVAHRPEDAWKPEDIDDAEQP